jgi:uncharacterized protein YfaS (alpha-2-macroglobulin family)
LIGAAFLALALGVASPAAGQGTPSAASPKVVPPPAAAEAGVAVVPDRFLRRWDPVTFFFDRAVGPEKPGGEDRPGRLVTMSPAQPGAYTWLDARTLQFRPADPWPALARVTFKVGGTTFRLATLMSEPRSTEPRAGQTGLRQVESVTLTFDEPLAEEALAQATSFELRPLPGIGEGRSRWLDRRDFVVKPLERASPGDPASYVLALREALPLGHRVLVFVQRSLEPIDGQDSGRQQVLEFATAEPFRAISLGCPGAMVPLTPEGSRFKAEQALRCDGKETLVRIELSAAPRAFTAVDLRNLLRIEPHVANLDVKVQGKVIEARGAFQRDQAYRLTLLPTALQDDQGRVLDQRAASEVFVYFTARASFLEFKAASGQVERLGPQRVPVQGRGYDKADLRIFPIDPLDRRFWPFPGEVSVDESLRPPGPGEEVAADLGPGARPTPRSVAEQIRQLGSPVVSTLVDLPLSRKGGGADFGLELRPHLAKAGGAQAPGTYLVGLRRLEGGAKRSWMRVQVTDLSLTTVDEGRGVTFVVTSLSTARPVAGAEVRVEGVFSPPNGARQFGTLFSGRTDADGRLRWDTLGGSRSAQVRRLVVAQGDDVLTLDPGSPPETFADGSWRQSYQDWLQWAFESLAGRGPEPRELAHLFSERPVYRPEEPVHLKAYVRIKEAGALRPAVEEVLTLVIEGPGERVWREAVTTDDYGSFYDLFEDEDTPSGTYSAYIELADGSQLARCTFRKEAYRLPTFQVMLTGPPKQIATLDRDFKVQLAASYYAGGRVAQRPVAWRVTQYPHTVATRERSGFVFSSDGRFSRTDRFRSTPTLQLEELTDDNGGAALTLNPAIEPTAQPRVYVVEATVTDVDDSTVTATQRIVALPPFVLGLKAPRFLDVGEKLEPEILVLGPTDEPLVGQALTVRLLRRQWHSHLQASDFSDGAARYVTDVVDELVTTREVTSTAEPLHLPLPTDGAGVYVIEVEGRDRLGRAQVIAVDLFAAGDEKVAWPKPTAQTFEVSADKASYKPGETAHLVLQSPFQQGSVLVAVEAPGANRYAWVEVHGGQGLFDLTIEDAFTPKLPIHFLLMRGRLPGVEPQAGNTVDLGKPATLAATKWLTVEPIAHQLKVGLSYPKEAQPGKEIEIEVTLADPDGKPRSGQVTLWLVDQAVLALGREQRLDPLPSFVVTEPAHLGFQDSRSMVFGLLPMAEMPGGGSGLDGDLFDRQTPRKNIVPVPFYEPDLRVGLDGRLKVKVQLPDNLTNFEIRAKAASLPDRFGFATGHLEVRLPVIVQPSLPRFVRPGDQFTATAIGRLVAGEPGPGQAQAQFEGLRLEGPASREISLQADKPSRLDFQVTVPSESGRRSAKVKLAVERRSDRAGDAVEVDLPIVDDRRPVVRREVVDLVAGQPYVWPAVPEPARPGSVRRELLVADQPALVRMATALDMLVEYPYGCTEQRLSRAEGLLAFERFREALKLAPVDDIKPRVEETLAWIQQVVRPDGLCAYWPGSEGYVSLTAWTLQFMVAAKQAGYEVNPAVQAKIERALAQSLRSDYAQLVDGSQYAERIMALQALAEAGKFDSAYGAELARRVELLGPEEVARLLLAWQRSGQTTAPRQALVARLWDGVQFRLHQGQEIYAGLRNERPQSPLILPSEARTLAQIVEALAALDRQQPRFQPLVEALVRLGRDDGWGSTQADAAALSALAQVTTPDASSPEQMVEIRWPDGKERLTWRGGGKDYAATRAERAEIVWQGSAANPIALRSETRYVPSASAAEEQSARQGFVIERELLLIDREAGVAPRRVALSTPQELSLAIGQVVEEHIQVVSSGERHFVAIEVPLAAGMEPLNPALETAPPEARPTGKITLEPTYADYRDDHVAFYFNHLPAGTYDFYFRTRAQFAGAFTQPPARAALMYDAAVWGQSAGARLRIAP